MYLGYFTIVLAQDYGLTAKDLKGLCQALTSRFHVLARHLEESMLAVVALSVSEQRLKQTLDNAIAFLETKIGRVEPNEFFIESIGDGDG